MRMTESFRQILPFVIFCGNLLSSLLYWDHTNRLGLVKCFSSFCMPFVLFLLFLLVYLDARCLPSLSETKLSANKKSEKDIDFVAVLDVPGNQWKIFASKQRNFSNLFYEHTNRIKQIQMEILQKLRERLYHISY